MRQAFRIVEVDDAGVMKTLFHGINGSRVLVKDQWYVAQERLVSDGGTEYMSGFHVMFELADCRRYLQRFKHQDNKRIVRCQVRGRIRKKEHSPANIWLVSELRVQEFVDPWHDQTTSPTNTAVDLTPTWEAVMPGLISVLETGTEEGKRFVREELMDLARKIDRSNEFMKKL